MRGTTPTWTSPSPPWPGRPGGASVRKRRTLTCGSAPWDPEKEQELYLAARRDTWITVHGTELPFDGPGFWEVAQRDLDQSPWGVSVAMSGDQFAGMIQMDLERFRDANAGYIPLCYMSPEFRNHRLGVQLLGHAVSFFRRQGRQSCACAAR